VELARRFDLYHQLPVDNHIQSLLRKRVTLVKDRYGDFTRNTMPTLDQLPLQRHYINMLEKSESERIVDLEECPDYRVCESRFKEFATRHPQKVAA
jgi:hypothetical protein